MKRFITKLKKCRNLDEIKDFLRPKGWRSRSGVETLCFLKKDKKFCVKIGKSGFGNGSSVQQLLDYQKKGGKVFTPILHYIDFSSEGSCLQIVIAKRVSVPNWNHTEGKIFALLRSMVGELDGVGYNAIIRTLEGAFYSQGLCVGDVHFGNFVLNSDNSIEIFDYGCLVNVESFESIDWKAFWQTAADILRKKIQERNC